MVTLVRNFATHGQLSTAQGSPTTVSARHPINITFRLLTAWFGPEVALTWSFPYPILPSLLAPARRRRRRRRPGRTPPPAAAAAPAARSPGRTAAAAAPAPPAREPAHPWSACVVRVCPHPSPVRRGRALTPVRDRNAASLTPPHGLVHVSRSDIRLISTFYIRLCGLMVRRWRLIGYFPILHNPPHGLCGLMVRRWRLIGYFPILYNPQRARGGAPRGWGANGANATHLPHRHLVVTVAVTGNETIRTGARAELRA
jgi:hypothetical protein